MKSHDRFVALAIALVVASTFGPYLVGGVRTDQAVIYGLAVAAVVLAPWTWLRLVPTPMMFGLFMVWLVYAAIGLAGTIGAPRSHIFEPGALLAGVDNLALPLAVMILVWLLVVPARREMCIDVACRTLAWLAAGNAVLAVASSRLGLTPILRPFWAPGGDVGLTTAEKAQALGRFGGIFNQPMEAGLMYALAGLAVVYAYRDQRKTMFVLLSLIFLGGVLSVSKVFLLVGAPLILWSAWAVVKSRAVPLIAAGVVVLAVAQSGVLSGWSGALYLQRLIRPGQSGLIDFYSAGRFGETSSLSTVVSEVSDVSPLFGLGARGLMAAYDNGWVEAFVVAGTVGVVAYTVTLVLMLRVPAAIDGPGRRLALCVALVASVGSLGVPALTVNRAGSLVWMLVALLVVARPRLLGGPAGVAGSGLLDIHGRPRAAGSVEPEGPGRGRLDGVCQMNGG